MMICDKYKYICQNCKKEFDADSVFANKDGWLCKECNERRIQLNENKVISRNKEKLEKVKETLEFYANDDRDDGDRAQETIALIYSIIAELDSEELIDDVIRQFRFEFFPDGTFRNDIEVAENIIKIIKEW